MYKAILAFVKTIITYILIFKFIPTYNKLIHLSILQYIYTFMLLNNDVKIPYIGTFYLLINTIMIQMFKKLNFQIS